MAFSQKHRGVKRFLRGAPIGQPQLDKEHTTWLKKVMEKTGICDPSAEFIRAWEKKGNVSKS